MKGLFSIFLLFFTVLLNAQNGETVLYFKNGDTVYGKGALKGAREISFRKENTSKKIRFDFDILEKAEIKLNDSVTITYRLFPITKKDGTPKDASVLGELVSGNVSLYVKGKVSDISKLPHSDMLNYNILPTGRMGKDQNVHYFLRKHGEENAVHLNSSQFTIHQLLYGAGMVFSDCPEVYQYMMPITKHIKSLNEAIEYYNKKCAALN